MSLASSQQAPAYQRTGCPVCAQWAAANREYKKEFRAAIIKDHPEKLAKTGAFPWCPSVCTNCQKPLPEEGYEQGRVMEGFNSFTINHHHMKDVAGVAGRTAVLDRLCFDCLLVDWNVHYPDQEYGAAEE